MIGVLVGAAYRYWRDVFRGVHRYCNAHGPFRLFAPLAFGYAAPQHIPDLDALVTRADTSELALLCQQQRDAGVKVVDVTGNVRAECSFPQVHVDDHAVGRFAAQHLLEQGFQKATCVTFAGREMLKDRVGGFMETMRQGGASLLEPQPFGTQESWHVFTGWLGSLPSNIGLFVPSDALATSVMQELRYAGRSVPQQVAVIGAGNDDVVDESVAPPLTSVDVGGERVGYKAAELAANLLQGAPAPDKPISLTPLRVVERRSTDRLAFGNANLVRALRFLRSHACDPIGVPDVLKAVPISRRWLETMFRETLGTTPNREIQRVRVNRAKHLLLETDLSLEHIRQLCGYHHVRNFGDAFKAATGMPPGTYRAAAATGMA
jgi:LacI family transcriptional regulator